MANRTDGALVAGNTHSAGGDERRGRRPPAGLPKRLLPRIALVHTPAGRGRADGWIQYFTASDRPGAVAAADPGTDPTGPAAPDGRPRRHDRKLHDQGHAAQRWLGIILAASVALLIVLPLEPEPAQFLLAGLVITSVFGLDRRCGELKLPIYAGWPACGVALPWLAAW